MLQPIVELELLQQDNDLPDIGARHAVESDHCCLQWLARQSENAGGKDIALDLGCAAIDRRRPREQELARREQVVQLGERLERTRQLRSEERRGGQESVRTCKAR